MKRRTFIQSTAAAAVGTQILGGVPLKAFSPKDLDGLVQAGDDNILIVVQLFGGNDGLNTIIPVDDDQYYAIRPAIAVQKQLAVPVVPGRLYFHPALDPAGAYNLRRMFDDGRLAVVQGIGYENPNLSHFRSTDIWLSGFNTSDPDRRLIDGWLGRYFADHLPDFPATLPDHPTAVQIGGSLSMLLQSPKGDVGIALTDPDKFFQLGQGLSPDLEAMPGDTAYEREFNFVRLVAEQSDRYSSVVKEAFDKGRNTLQYATNGFVRQMQLVARLISGGLKSKVYMVYMGGFDTHVQQQHDDLTGLHPFLLNALSTGIGQFMQDALAQGFADRVVGMTVSEFGRRPYENGSRGTDHGTSSIQFVFGNGVNAGVFGQSPDLTNFDSNGDLVYQYDYRTVYADILENWFGGSPDETKSVFDLSPNENILPLGVIKKTVSSVDAYEGRVPVHVRLAPNPVTDVAWIEWSQTTPAMAKVDIYDGTGRFVERVWHGAVDPGSVRLPISVTASGSYLCAITVNGARTVVPFTVIK